MTDLTRWTYDSHVTSFLRPRQLTTHFHLNDPNGSGRAASVGTFKHLKHFDINWDADDVTAWAKHHGWQETDISLLEEFARGVQIGTRFHTGPIPLSRDMAESWLRGISIGSAIPDGLSFRRLKCCRGAFKEPVQLNLSRATFSLLEDE